ncbi:hypothetical protein [Streptomyces subrutilus]
MIATTSGSAVVPNSDQRRPVPPPQVPGSRQPHRQPPHQQEEQQA